MGPVAEAGEDFDRVTERALAEARTVVVLWSKRSVDSRWVRATEAKSNNCLVPVMITLAFTGRWVAPHDRPRRSR